MCFSSLRKVIYFKKTKIILAGGDQINSGVTNLPSESLLEKPFPLETSLPE